MAKQGLDRRQQRTREAIFRAFSALLARKRYDHITVQEIIDAANIGRSTFYAHFETKDALLRAVCTELFAHIVSEEPLREATHDFSHGAYGLAERLAHILYHIRDRRQDLCGLLRGDGLFLRYFCEYLTGLFAEYLPARTAVPRDFLLDQLTGGFAGAARWWMRTGMAQRPEQVAAYFLACAAPLQSGPPDGAAARGA